MRRHVVLRNALRKIRGALWTTLVIALLVIAIDLPAAQLLLQKRERCTEDELQLHRKPARLPGTRHVEERLGWNSPAPPPLTRGAAQALRCAR